MTTSEIIANLLIMISGLGIFMYGLKIMSDMLEKGASEKLRLMFGKITNNRYMGIAVGAGVTGIIQSSSATTVMVVGFVNAGMLTLFQATSIIMGANIGTTVTGLIISLKSLPVTPFFAALCGVGVFMILLSKNIKIINIGSILAGLGMIFGGLIVMGDAMTGFSKLESIRIFFASTTNPFVLVLIGLIVTAIIQSSSATSGILITMGSAGLIGIDTATFIILGINIGTCITALLASVGTNVNARRAAVIHLMFNVFGAILFFILLIINPVKDLIIRILPGAIETEIAVFHLIFNITTTAILSPFIKFIVALATKLVPDRKGAAKFENELSFQFINDLMLETPALAVEQVKKEILRMGAYANDNLQLAIHAVLSCSLDDKTEFDKREALINYLNKNMTRYLVKVSSLEISFRDEIIIGTYYHVISDIERIGDYAENLMDYVEKQQKEKCFFSDEAKEEIREMYKTIMQLYGFVKAAFINEDLTSRQQAEIIEENVDEFKRSLSMQHIKRLNEGICTPSSGAIYLSLISNLERIADHMINISNSIKDYAKKQKVVAGDKNV